MKNTTTKISTVNPPAYPEIETEFGSSGRQYSTVKSGMTLLDYFAGQSLQGLVVDLARGRYDVLEIVEISYKAAKLMLIEREKHL